MQDTMQGDAVDAADVRSAAKRRPSRRLALAMLGPLAACSTAPNRPAVDPGLHLHYVVQVCRAEGERDRRPALDAITPDSVSTSLMKPVARTQAGQTVYEERAAPSGEARFFVVKPRGQEASVWDLKHLPPAEPYRWTPWLAPTARSDEALLPLKLMGRRVALSTTSALSDYRLRYRLLSASEHDEFQRQRRRLTGLRSVEAPPCS